MFSSVFNDLSCSSGTQKSELICQVNMQSVQREMIKSISFVVHQVATYWPFIGQFEEICFWLIWFNHKVLLRTRLGLIFAL